MLRAAGKQAQQCQPLWMHLSKDCGDASPQLLTRFYPRRYVLDSVADNNQRYLVDRHIQAAAEVEALLE